MNLIRYSEHDIGRDLARRAYNGTSWSPEKRGDDTITSYLTHMQAVDEEFSQWTTDDNRDEIACDLEAYCTKYAELLRTYLASHSNVMSTMITGPANFPARRNEKRSDWADAHQERWLEFSKAQLERLRRKWDPCRRANAPVSSDDADAVDRLQVKVAQAERLQEAMKAANRIVRGKLTDDQKVAEMVALGIGEQAARQVLVPDYMGRVGFPDYTLKNNGANIRRMKGRIEELERTRQDVTAEVRVGGVRVVDNVEDNRVQIFFPGKPSADIRTRLKGNGFHWMPSIGSWQRQRSPYVLQLAQEIAAIYN